MPRDPAPALWAGLLALCALRAALAFVPGMWGWGLNGLRHAPPGPGWILWLAGAAACVPALAERLARATARPFAARANAGPWLAGGAAAIAMALVWALPDRVWFLGDYIIRIGAVEQRRSFDVLFPQSLPLDVLLHGRLPEWLGVRSTADVARFYRVLGSLEAGALVLLGARFAAALRARAAVACAVAAIAVLGGDLAMFTGFGKCAGELCLVVVALGAFGLASIEDPRHLLPMNVALAVGLLLHRSAVLLVLPALAAALLAWRAHGSRATWGSVRGALALLVPVVALAAVAPRLWHIFRTFDLPLHLVPRGAAAHTGALGAAFSGLHLLDLANLLVALSPLLPLAPVLALARQRERASRGEGTFMAVLAGAFLPALLFAHPQQGVFRDWDVFAPAGVALSLLVAWLAARSLERRPGREWLAAPLALGALVPALTWLLVAHDLDRGLARVAAFADGPPVRDETTRAQVWDAYGLRCIRLERWGDANRALGRSAEAIPNPRVLREWALAATMADDYATAQRTYGTLLARQPEDPIAWLGLAGVSLRLRDSTNTRIAIGQLARYANDSAALGAMQAYLAAYPKVWPYPLAGLSGR